MANKQNNDKIEYLKQVVFFIDILAFKDMVQGKNKKTANEIAVILQKINNFVDSDIFGKDTSKAVTQFSDSVILSFNYNKPSGLFYAILDLLHLQFEIFHGYNILIRGACCLGDAYHDDKYCFGQAVNESYLLQEKCAIYPRIIISEKIIEECAKHSIHENYNEESDIKQILKQDTDGYWYIDYFSYGVLISEMDEPEYWGYYMQEIKRNIEIGLINDNISIKQKYLWLKDKYNKALSDKLINFYENNYGIKLQKLL